MVDLWELLPLESQTRVLEQVARDAPGIWSERRDELRQILAKLEHRRIGASLVVAALWWKASS